MKTFLRTNGFYISVALIFGVSLSLRTVSLGGTGYWIDEMSSIHFASNKLWSALLWDNSPPTYHFLLKIWIWLFGTAEVATRSLSVLFSALTTLLWVWFGKSRYGTKTAIVAGLAHSVFAFSILGARQTRMYSLFELTSTLFLFALVREIESSNNQTFVKSKSFISAFAMAIIHYLSIVPIVSWSLANVVLKKNIKRNLLLAGIATFAGISYTTIVRFESLQWQILKFKVEPESRYPFELLQGLFGGLPGEIIFLALAIFLIAFSSRKKYVASNLLYIFPPVIGAFIISYIFNRSVFLPRYFIYLIPTVILFLLEGVGNLQTSNRILRIAAYGLFVGFLGLQFKEGLVYVNTVNPPWREAAEILNNAGKIKLYTSRPLSLKSPYFNEENIEFIKIDPRKKDQADIRLIFFNAKEHQKDSWIIENYWGLEAYREELTQIAIDYHCKMKSFSQSNESRDTIAVLKVECPY